MVNKSTGRLASLALPVRLHPLPIQRPLRLRIALGTVARQLARPMLLGHVFAAILAAEAHRFLLTSAHYSSIADLPSPSDLAQLPSSDPVYAARAAIVITTRHG